MCPAGLHCTSRPPPASMPLQCSKRLQLPTQAACHASPPPAFCVQACPGPCLFQRWPPKYRQAVRTLLCCALRGRQQIVHAAAVAGALASEQHQPEAPAAAPAAAALLASLPHEVLLRIAALAAAPLSAWQ